jgi:hypothetical protein
MKKKKYKRGAKPKPFNKWPKAEKQKAEKKNNGKQKLCNPKWSLKKSSKINTEKVSYQMVSRIL